MLTASGYITTAEFTANNPTVDVSVYSTPTLSGIIATATGKVDDYLGFTLPMEIITDEKVEARVDSDFNLSIWPRKRPIDTVTAIDIVKGSDTITLTLQDGNSADKFDVPEPKIQILYPDAELATTGISTVGSFQQIRNTNFFVKLDYTAGYHSPPEWAKEATELYVLDILARRQNTVGASKIKQGQVSIEYVQRRGKSDLVQDAEEILSYHRKVAGF